MKCDTGDGLFGWLRDGITEIPLCLIGQIRGQQTLCKLVGHSNVVAPFGLAKVPARNRSAWHGKANFGGTISEDLYCDLGNFSRMSQSDK